MIRHILLLFVAVVGAKFQCDPVTNDFVSLYGSELEKKTGINLGAESRIQNPENFIRYCKGRLFKHTHTQSYNMQLLSSATGIGKHFGGYMASCCDITECPPGNTDDCPQVNEEYEPGTCDVRTHDEQMLDVDFTTDCKKRNYCVAGVDTVALGSAHTSVTVATFVYDGAKDTGTFFLTITDPGRLSGRRISARLTTFVVDPADPVPPPLPDTDVGFLRHLTDESYAVTVPGIRAAMLPLAKAKATLTLYLVPIQSDTPPEQNCETPPGEIQKGEKTLMKIKESNKFDLEAKDTFSISVGETTISASPITFTSNLVGAQVGVGTDFDNAGFSVTYRDPTDKQEWFDPDAFQVHEGDTFQAKFKLVGESCKNLNDRALLAVAVNSNDKPVDCGVQVWVGTSANRCEVVVAFNNGLYLDDTDWVSAKGKDVKTSFSVEFTVCNDARLFRSEETKQMAAGGCPEKRRRLGSSSTAPRTMAEVDVYDASSAVASRSLAEIKVYEGSTQTFEIIVTPPHILIQEEDHTWFWGLIFGIVVGVSLCGGLGMYARSDNCDERCTPVAAEANDDLEPLVTSRKPLVTRTLHSSKGD